ncbi:cyclin-A1-4-like isoform X3 [Typha latifolia]|uniref:cyclin-A1-4-like isoform X3 n=1 Tax=Typha latifolia TaxID=4733 RepID=UPI003C2D236C
MSTSKRRSSLSSGPVFSSSSTKRAAAAAPTENSAKMPAATVEQAKKRVALGNITNQGNAGRAAGRLIAGVAKGTNKVNPTSSTSTVKKGSTTTVRYTSLQLSSLATSAAVKPTTLSSKDISLPATDGSAPTTAPCILPCSTVISPGHSGDSVSLDDTMSICDSMKSPDFEYIDNGDSSAVASLERRANENLHISDSADAPGSKLKRGLPTAMDIDHFFEVDSNYEDPQLCATLACDIYKHLRLAETKKRPSTDFMEKIQTDINASMRAILIDWLVEVAEEYRLVPDTLYLTVNYIDRYLSGNEINRQRLQLLGVSCMLIAAKYEEICAPQVEEFCYITDNTYFKDEVLQMEAAVLKYLRFEMTAPTAKCFLRRFVRVAQVCDEAPLLQLEFLANYVAELSLLEYGLLCYSPSLVAASSIFLAKFILQPTKNPWNATLGHYTLYKPSELCDCVKALHRLFCSGPGSNLPSIREKYSQHKYKFVAKKYCPPSIPSKFFQDTMN